MKPRLLRSDMTGAVYVVTRYKDLGEGRFMAQTKYDVTEDYEAVAGSTIPPLDVEADANTLLGALPEDIAVALMEIMRTLVAYRTAAHARLAESPVTGEG